ncbi:hypothetical protein GDO81_019341 [Engystomops pustulosus]|uniref:P-type domain-containing protein n=1 Tax=Engystomops pustulosus TaxID=76066 RepID=A0AAV6ZAP4_ENGPU|nr:hypothetical protein GDO81_019341 [Engystomops pustulosus]
MGRYTVCWVVSILILGADAAYLPPNYSCAVQPGLRKDCGYNGITADECVKKGCCFDDWRPDTIRCYIPWTPQVIVRCKEYAPRVDCGFPGITKDQCNQKGCCYDSSDPKALRCFYPDIM